MHTLKLKKPLAFFDLETTGINIANDRIVEIAIVKAMPNGEILKMAKKIHPDMPIPIASSLIHGIYDKDVEDAPKFKQVAKNLAQFFEGADLAGFNIIKFDVPMLVEEFLRAEVDFDISNRRLIDAQRIFHLMEPRNLSAAYRFYCGEELNNAHSAEADTFATYKVLEAQIQKYEGREVKDEHKSTTTTISNDMDILHELTASKMVDLAGRLGFNEKGDIIFKFGKHINQPVKEVFKKEPTYYDWMMKGDFPLDTKRKITEIKLSDFNKK